MDARFIDTENLRDDRKAQAGSDKREQTHLPSRRERRLTAKKRGIFRHPFGWQQANRHTKYSHHQEPIKKGDNSEQE